MTELQIRCRGERLFSFAPAGTALIVIDMQRDFFSSSDQPAMPQTNDPMQAIIPRVADLIAVARLFGCRVIHTREGYSPDFSDVSAFRASLGYVGEPGPGGRCLIRGEHGHDFLDELKPAPGETIIEKAGFSAFHATALDQQLSAASIERLILCGVTTQCCVHSTLRSAVDLGYWCLTIADCCAAQDPQAHEAALSLISAEGHLFGWVCDLDDFKTILPTARPCTTT